MTAFLPGDRVAWYSAYVSRVYSGAVEVVATGRDGNVARVQVEGTGEQTVVECSRLSLVPDPRPATIIAVLDLVSVLAEVRTALEDDAADRTVVLESVEFSLSELLTAVSVAGTAEAGR